MKKRTVIYGSTFSFLHLVIFTMAIYIYKLPGKYEALLVLISVPIYIYEFPMFLIDKLLSIPIDDENIKFILGSYFFGAIIYFFIGSLVAYLSSLSKGKSG